MMAGDITRPVLLDKTREELAAYLAERHQPAFRAGQLFGWLHRGVGFDQMTNLPLALRESLAASALANPVTVAREYLSARDDTVKFLYELADGLLIEGVLMNYHHGRSLCLSTQVGCRMGCVFCASALDGMKRNLSSGEMLGQVLCANRYLESKDERARVGNLVLMGSGEPLDNYDAVIKFLRLLSDEDGLNISLRSVSLSTCGLVPEIWRLAGEGLPLTLSLSLHAPDDKTRAALMPIARKYPVASVMEAVRGYVAATGRRVIIEYALIQGVNDSLAQADALAGLLRAMQCHVNLIPLNSVKDGAPHNLLSTNRAGVAAFLNQLTSHHISATVRREMGGDIEGACGQLRRRALEGRDCR